MINKIQKIDCCGCTACQSVCPKACIKMVEDKEGFLYPDVDEKMCVKCGLCEKVCPVCNPITPSKRVRKGYVARCSDLQTVEVSTSGGMFTPIAKAIIAQKGVICAAKYDRDFNVIHSFLNSNEDVHFQAYRGSKYVQSDLNNCFRKIKEKIENNQLVCFIGTTCQVNGLRKYVGYDDNLILIDLVCHGTPSPKLWRKYLEYQKRKYNSEIKSISFRNKTYGYHSSTMKIEFEDGKVYYGSARIDLMMKSFFEEISSRPICYSCPFKSAERVSDISLYDCWHVSALVPNVEDDDKGYTNIIVHSEKGERLLADIKDEIEIYEVDVEKAIQLDGSMVRKSAIAHCKRDVFYDDIDQYELDEHIQRFIPISKTDYLIERFKIVLYKLGVFYKLKRLLKKD